MNYLLDTHIVIWWLTTPRELSKPARTILEDKHNQIYVSTASFWEMAIKQSLGRITVPRSMLTILMSEGFKFLPILPEEALGVVDLPLLHGDPFDRMLIIQAKTHDLILITRDKEILEYPVPCIKG